MNPELVEPFEGPVFSLLVRQSELLTDGAVIRVRLDGEKWFDGQLSCVLVGNVGRLTGGLEAFPGARHVMYDGWNFDATRNAQEKCYGTKVLPRYHFDKAEYCLMLNADPLGSGYSSLEWNVGYGKQRKVRNG